ncbi:MAG: MmcQ/YjbR family DNA-binding protein [Pseudomonadota bacterium]
MADATEPIRQRASEYPNVDEGTSCTQSSFKTGGKAFLFIGEQGGRHKAMFKLKASRDEAARMAAKAPKDFQIGKGVWITARFSDDAPLSDEIWKRWLDESYELSQ